MSRNPGRPLSPHLTIWKWGPAMAVSILHRITGTGLAIVAGIGFIWWLVAAATGAEAYDTFLSWADSWLGYIVAIGLTWALLQHLFSGVRHFVLDMGAGYDLRTNKTVAVLIMAAPPLATLLIWGPLLAKILRGAE